MRKLYDTVIFKLVSVACLTFVFAISAIWAMYDVVSVRVLDVPSLAEYMPIRLITAIAPHLATKIVFVAVVSELLLYALCYFCAHCRSISGGEEEDKSGSAFVNILVFIIILAVVLLFVWLTVSNFVSSWVDRLTLTTIQDELDEDWHQSDLGYIGELGFYGGLTTDPESGTKMYYICRSIDNYGPFDASPLANVGEQAFVDGYELFNMTEDGTVYSVTMRRYDDGYWVVLKSFSSTEKLNVEIEHAEDLVKYISQLEFSNHRSTKKTQATSFIEMEARLDEAGFEH